MIEALTVDVNRIRLALEASYARTLESGGALTPSLEVGVRHDGGDGETGTDVEFGAGLRYADGSGLTVEGQGRVLVVHGGDREEWGLSGLMRLDPGADNRGLSFSLVPALGDTASGVDRLWQRRFATDRNADDRAPQPRLDAEMGHGFAAYGRGVLTLYGALALAGEGSQHYRLGTRFEMGRALRLSL